MKETIEQIIQDYVSNYEKNNEIKTSWRPPTVAFAAADDPLFEELKEAVSPSHAKPEDILGGAKTVIAYFLPFTKSIIASNVEGKYSSKEWAYAYIETNQLIEDLNKKLKLELEKKDYNVSTVSATHQFDKANLISDWSHRHAAYIAGLGTFGVNNMLITEKGCAGRVGTLITDLKVEPSVRKSKEYCLSKAGIDCNKCVDRCVTDALSVDDFARFKCYNFLLKNDDLHSELDLSDVCGKCCVDLPCSLTDPTK